MRIACDLWPEQKFTIYVMQGQIQLSYGTNKKDFIHLEFRSSQGLSDKFLNDRMINQENIMLMWRI